MKIARDKETRRRSQKRHTTTIDDADDAKDRNSEGKRSILEIRKNAEKLYWRIYVTVFYAKIVRVTYSSGYQFCSLSQLANLASTLRLF